MITLHEFGHYLFARIFRVEIKEFSIGMGPQIFSRISKKTNIKYSLRLFPVGGYVSMTGEDEESDSENALCNKPVLQRIIITSAGAVFNILSGVILSFIVIVTSGMARKPGQSRIDLTQTNVDIIKDIAPKIAKV